MRLWRPIPTPEGSPESRTIIAKSYELFFRKPAPDWMRQTGPFMLVWKRIRKLLNVVIIPHIPLNPLRILAYRLIGFRIGKGVFIGMRCYLDDVCPKSIVIEDNVTISYCVVFAAHGPGADDKQIILHSGCYVGTNATLLGGAEVGRCAAVGACALVNKPVPPFCVVAGVPARVVRTTPIPGTPMYRKFLAEQGKPTA